jgi:hypothetical protein
VLSRAIYRKQRGRRPLTALAVLSVITGLLISSGTVLAVHDEDFQLDGDVVASTTTNAGGSTQNVDWDSIFDAAGDEVASLPSGFTDAAFVKDFQNTGNTFITSDNSTYATGSKDTLPISGWQCNQDNNVNSKIDVMNAYTVAGSNAAGDEIVYFALERNTNTGTADVGFWFLQDEVGCESTGSAVTFTGEHTDGDVLVVSEFSNGGVVSTINVYRWDGGANGSLNPVPVGAGVDCRDATTLPGDSACAAANTTANGTGGTITTPWLTANFKDKVGHSLRTSEFFEGGINLTDLGLGGQCFSSFLGDTRSSTSLTATLFDFAGGTIGSCTATVTTQPSQTTRLISSTAAITDTATVTGQNSSGGTGSTPTGTVSFFLCAPSELTPADTGVCDDSNGTAVTGNPVALVETVPGTSSATSGDAQSLITGLGKYCFRATFSGTGDYAGQIEETSNPANECFTVTGSTSLTTDQNWVPNDSATITGDSALSGTATFDLYHSSDCTGTSLYTANVPVSGASPQTVSTSNTTTVVVVDGTSEGNYSWRVSYNDDVLADTAASCTEVSNITITE